MLQKEIEGFPMFLDNNEKEIGVSRALIGNGAREKAFMKILRQEIDGGDICVDLGANIGYTTLSMCKATGKNGKVYAIEPDLHNYKILVSNIHLNNYEKFTKMYNMAISNKNEIGKFYISTDRSNLHSAKKSDIHDKEVNILYQTLDEFFKNENKLPNFIKMDIEGHEVEVLQGMKNILQTQNKLKLLIELHSEEYNENHSFKNELKKLFNWGFKFRYFVSAGSADINEFEKLGYKSLKKVHTDNVNRYLFENMSNEHAIDITSRKPQIVRSIMLKKNE